MTLNEAINHYEELIEKKDDKIEEYKQIVCWLKELAMHRDTLQKIYNEVEMLPMREEILKILKPRFSISLMNIL